MGLKEETRTVDGQRYHFTQLPFKRSRRLWVVLVQRLGPSLGQLLSGVTSLSEAVEQNVDIGGAIAQLTQQLTDDDLDYVTTELASSCLYEDGGKWPSLKDEIETHFSGSIAHWLKWMRAGLEVNYGDFFDALKSAMSDSAQPKTEGVATDSS